LKIRADEHVSPEIVRAIRDMALGPDWKISSVLDHDRGSDDVHWITHFARDSGHAILSVDTDFFKVPQQVVAIFDTKLRVIHLPAKWANAACHLQAAHLLLWWRRIEACVAEMDDSQCFRPAAGRTDRPARRRYHSAARGSAVSVSASRPMACASRVNRRVTDSPANTP
jgi:hypothetical protein